MLTRLLWIEELRQDDYFLLMDIYEGSEIVGTSGHVMLEVSIGAQKLPVIKTKDKAKKGKHRSDRAGCHLKSYCGFTGSARFYQQIETKVPVSHVTWSCTLHLPTLTHSSCRSVRTGRAMTPHLTSSSMRTPKA